MIAWGGVDWKSFSDNEKKYLMALIAFGILLSITSLIIEYKERRDEKKDEI